MTDRIPKRKRNHVVSDGEGADGNTDSDSENSPDSCVRNLERGYVCVVGGREEFEEIPEGVEKHITSMLEYEAEANGGPEKWDALDEALQKHPNPPVDSLPTKIYGPSELQRSIRGLLEKFSSCFRRTVAPTPALITPMKLKVDEVQWNSSRLNNNKPRPQTPKKNAEIDRQVEILKGLNVVRDSDATRYSHVHLVPKPEVDSWRFTLDYRWLNLCSEMEGGVIPVIPELLQSLGSKHPTRFGVIDFTSGYHQAPLHEDSRKYTAFRTHRGIYEWNRVPMGLKGGPNYFQKEVSTTVLGTLLGSVCELYIDDNIIFAQNDEEFLSNLEKVLQKLQDKKITCNPDKCRFGLDSVEFLGRIIDAKGIRIPEDKILDVINFPQPTLLKELQSFVGMVNYFAEHLRDASAELGALRRFHENAVKNKKLVWTTEATAQFQRIKELVNKLPKLYFINGNDPFIVYTEASDYGIVVYIHFINKS
jgi:hypothetical protein